MVSGNKETGFNALVEAEEKLIGANNTKSFFSKAWDVLNYPLEDLVAGAAKRVGKAFAETMMTYSLLTPAFVIAQQAQPSVPPAVVQPAALGTVTIDYNKVDEIVKILEDNDVAIFQSTIAVKPVAGNAHSVDLCLEQPNGAKSRQDSKRGKTATLARDAFNTLGVYENPDSLVLEPVQKTVGAYVVRNRQNQAKIADFDSKKIKLLRVNNQPTAPFTDIVYANPVRGITADTGNVGGASHILYIPGTCMVVGPEVLQYADDKLLLAKAKQNQVERSAPPAVAPTPRPEPDAQTAPQSPATGESHVATGETHAATGETHPPKKAVFVNDSLNPVSSRFKGNNSRWRISAGGVLVPSSESYDVKSPDPTGTPLITHENLSNNYVGGQAVVGFGPFKKLPFELIAQVRYLNGNASNGSQSTQTEFGVGGTLKLSSNGFDLGWITALYSELNGEMRLTDADLELIKKLNTKGGSFMFTSPDLLADNKRMLQFLLFYTQLSGNTRQDLTIDLSAFGLPPEHRTDSSPYSISTIGGGIKAYVLPFGKNSSDPRSNIGFGLSGRYTSIENNQQGHDHGLKMFSAGPEIYGLFGVGKNGSAVELGAGFYPTQITSNDSSVEYKNAWNGMFTINYKFGRNTPDIFWGSPLH